MTTRRTGQREQGHAMSVVEQLTSNQRLIEAFVKIVVVVLKAALIT